MRESAQGLAGAARLALQGGHAYKPQTWLQLCDAPKCYILATLETDPLCGVENCWKAPGFAEREMSHEILQRDFLPVILLMCSSVGRRVFS